MAVRTKEEIFDLLKARVGDDNSDETLTFIEDLTDTFNDMDSRINDSGDWKSKYDDLSAKYKERFFSSPASPKEPEDEDEEQKPKKPMTFDDLFITKED